jgi:hypothetical protein
MKPFIALAILLYPAVAGCQQLPSLDTLLDRLNAYAKQYQATLPSLSCDAKITSQDVNRKGRIKREVKIQSVLREVRTDDPYNPFLEKREIKTVDGRRPRRNFQMSYLPFIVEGGFAGLVGFKRWEQRECFVYGVNSGENGHTVRLEMTLKTRLTSPSCEKVPAGFHRIVIADPETGRILHTERTIAPEAAIDGNGVYFGGIDYAPQKLGDQTFWLPSRFEAHDPDDTGRMFATYTNCHRYAGELKILPNVLVPGTGSEPR